MYKILLYVIFAFVLSIGVGHIASAESIQDQWIEDLRLCESQGRDNVRVLDTNNKYSYGSLQFQLDTFIGYGKKYEILPEELTRKEAELLIYNVHIQKAIAKEMLDDGLDYHWKNCRDKKIGRRYPISGKNT